MRFIFAIVAFVIAAALTGAGIAQRTVWAPPDHVSAQTKVAGGAPFIVISGRVLNAHPNQQTLMVSGSDNAFVAYGRTADVLGWLGDEEYAKVSYSATTGKLSSEVTRTPAADQPPEVDATPTPTPAPTAAPAPAGQEAQATPGPNPAGSDLWLQQFTGDDAHLTRMNVPNGISVIIADNGTKPAPNQVRIVWPLETATPWAGPLLAAGGLFLLIGLILLVLGVINVRRSRGPRRSGPKMPKLPRARPYKPSRQTSIGSSSRGRRAIGRSLVAVVPTVLVGALALTGCSAEYWPTLGTATPSETATPLVTELPKQGKKIEPPAVTVPQLEQVVTRISDVAKQADAALDATAITTRFAGPALELRKANYAIRASKTDQTPPHAIPASPLSVVLPQATSEWPRFVQTVIQDKTDAKAAPIVLVLEQKSPRENYLVHYAITLEPSAKVPDLAPATIGTALVPPDSKLLLLAPELVQPAYADILANGEKSKYFDMFEAKGDTLRAVVGPEYRATKKAGLPATASIEFTDSAGSGAPVAMATNDSGAIVAVSLNETETVKPVEAGATVSPEGAALALSGVESSTKGIQSVYGHQLLFYVPPANSKNKIRLLGFSAGLIASSEVQ